MHVTMISRYRRVDQERKSEATTTKTNALIVKPIVKYIRDKSTRVMQCLFRPAVSNKEE